MRFVVRWPPRYCVADAKGGRPLWQITPGKRSQDQRQPWDLNRRPYPKPGALAVPARHPRMYEPPRLAVSRPGNGRKPRYLLTNDPLGTACDARRVVTASHAYPVCHCERSAAISSGQQ